LYMIEFACIRRMAHNSMTGKRLNGTRHETSMPTHSIRLAAQLQARALTNLTTTNCMMTHAAPTEFHSETIVHVGEDVVDAHHIGTTVSPPHALQRNHRGVLRGYLLLPFWFAPPQIPRLHEPMQPPFTDQLIPQRGGVNDRFPRLHLHRLHVHTRLVGNCANFAPTRPMHQAPLSASTTQPCPQPRHEGTLRHESRLTHPSLPSGWLCTASPSCPRLPQQCLHQPALPQPQRKPISCTLSLPRILPLNMAPNSTVAAEPVDWPDAGSDPPYAAMEVEPLPSDSGNDEIIALFLQRTMGANEAVANSEARDEEDAPGTRNLTRILSC